MGSGVGYTYSIITPARDEETTLPRLADALERQTLPPTEWIIVENGSSDDTVSIGERIASNLAWARLLVLDARGPRERGAPIVHALRAGIAELDREPDVVVNVDADVTMEPGYFERLIHAFERDPRLGIASGSAWELESGAWRQRFVTGGTVWGATRAYRWECLRDVSPLEERHGWDGIDQIKARARGWATRTLNDLPFYHHRAEGEHERSTWAHWLVNGRTAHYMGYRPFYLLARTLHNIRRDPAALALIWGYVTAAARRSQRLDDPAAREVLRSDQSLRNIWRRRREALGLSGETPRKPSR